MKTTNQRRDHGIAALELVIVIPFLIALILAVVQVSVLFLGRIGLTNEARDAARTLALGGTPSYSSDVVVVAQSPACVAGDTTSNASVTLRRTVPFSIPLIPIGDQSFEARGTMRCGG